MLNKPHFPLSSTSLTHSSLTRSTHPSFPRPFEISPPQVILQSLAPNSMLHSSTYFLQSANRSHGRQYTTKVAVSYLSSTLSACMTVPMFPAILGLFTIVNHLLFNLGLLLQPQSHYDIIWPSGSLLLAWMEIQLMSIYSLAQLNLFSLFLF